MAARAFFVFCAHALLVQFSVSQCIGPIGIGAGLGPASLAYDGFARGVGCGAFTPVASTGGSFVVTSASPVAPIGVTVVSENVYEGALAVGGNLPLLGSVGLEGGLPTAGAGAVSYGCGDDAVAIVAEEGPIGTGIAGIGYGLGAGYGYAPAYGLAAGYGAAPYGYGYGLGYGVGYGSGYGLGYGPGAYGGYGCGCGAIY